MVLQRQLTNTHARMPIKLGLEYLTTPSFFPDCPTDWGFTYKFETFVTLFYPSVWLGHGSHIRLLGTPNSTVGTW